MSVGTTISLPCSPGGTWLFLVTAFSWEWWNGWNMNSYYYTIRWTRLSYFGGINYFFWVSSQVIVFDGVYYVSFVRRWWWFIIPCCPWYRSSLKKKWYQSSLDNWEKLDKKRPHCKLNLASIESTVRYGLQCKYYYVVTHTCTCTCHCVQRLLREVAISQAEEWISKETLSNKHLSQESSEFTTNTQ